MGIVRTLIAVEFCNCVLHCDEYLDPGYSPKIGHVGGGRLNQAAFSVDYKRKIINRSPLFFFLMQKYELCDIGCVNLITMDV